MITVRDEKPRTAAQLSRLLREHLKRHSPGEKVGTEVELTSRFGISRMTVRRAVEELIQQGLIERRAGKGIYVAGGQKEVKLIEFIVPALADLWYAPAVNSVQNICRQQGLDMLIRNAQINLENEIELVDQLPRSPADAAIIISVGNKKFTQELVALSFTPFLFVVIDEKFDLPNINWIVTDTYKAGYQAAQKLMALGHRRIAIVGDLRKNIGGGEALMRGVQDAMNDAGMLCDRSLFVNIPADSFLVDDKAEHKRKVCELMQRPARPTAFVMVRECYAAPICEQLLSMGFRVPRDVSIIGQGSDYRDSRVAIPLTCYASDAQKMGQIAVEMILSQAKMPHIAERSGVLLDAVWHEGASLAPAPEGK